MTTSVAYAERSPQKESVPCHGSPLIRVIANFAPISGSALLWESVDLGSLCYKSGSNSRTQVSGLVQNINEGKGRIQCDMSPDMQVNCKISGAWLSKNRDSQ